MLNVKKHVVSEVTVNGYSTASLDIWVENKNVGRDHADALSLVFVTYINQQHILIAWAENVIRS